MNAADIYGEFGCCEHCTHGPRERPHLIRCTYGCNGREEAA